ncbi:MAG: DoxX family protein [Candidatus Eremiobacteraeota bacterium]|nr:DoxX family protein [Candidatus Eremiobacteraeota bacterium]MBC5827713.1 DoxX family protein [Candidatus Eremiobacteraeota bacterium]
MKDYPKTVSRWVLSAGFLVAGTLHFVRPHVYARIVPPQLGHPLLLVYVSGCCEILGAIALLVPRLRKAAGYGLLALLCAVYPANIYMALHPEVFRDIAAPAALWLRLPLQFVLMAWVWWCCLV